MALDRPGSMTLMPWGDDAPPVPHIGDHDTFAEILRKLSLHVPLCPDQVELTDWAFIVTLSMSYKRPTRSKTFEP